MTNDGGKPGQDAGQPYLPPVPPDAEIVSAWQLPAEANSFFGRGDELKALHGFLENKTPNRAQVISIYGKAGVGKSTLATRFAYEIKGLYPDAQLYASLSPTPSATASRQTNEDRAGEVLADFLRALGTKGEAVPHTLGGKIGLYRSLLASKSALIFLDGAEAADLVVPLIPASASSLVLVTSRVNLAPLTRERLSLDVLDETSAVQLLAAFAGDTKIDSEPRAAREVVERCGRLPLAIVLAGARLASRNWSVDSLANRLRTNEANPLEEFRIGGTEIAATFSLSYEAASAAEQTLFRRLSVFSGPHFDHAAAAYLVPPGSENVAATLERLADLALLEAAPWPNWYQFHDLLRDFAKWHFETDESEQTRRECRLAVLTYYDNRLTRVDRSLQPTNVSSAKSAATDPGHEELLDTLRWLTRERENLVAAVTEAVRLDELDLACRLAAELASFFEVRAHYDDWLQTHAAVLEGTEIEAPEHRNGKALLTRSLGKLYYFRHDWAQAIANYQDALQLFLQLRQDREVAITLLYLGDAHRYKRDWDTARNTLSMSLQGLQAAGFRRGEAIALRSLGAVSRLTGEFDEAKGLYERALVIFNELRDERWIAATRLSLGDIYLDQGDAAGARPIFEECLRTFEEYDDRHWRALTLRSLGQTFRRDGDYDKAREFLDRSYQIVHKDGDKHWEAAIVEDLGELHAVQGQWKAAIERYRECIDMLTGPNQDRLVEARARKNLGVALNSIGDGDSAQQELRSAWLAFVEQKGPEAAEVLRLLSEPD